MSFNTAQFALFLPVVLLLYFVLHAVTRSRKAENLMLLLASCFFYGCWDHRFLFLFMFSTALDYLCGLAMGRQRPPALQAAVLAAVMLGGGVLLCAPIDWSGVYAQALPADAFSGGWQRAPNWSGLFVEGGSWRECAAALCGVGVVGTAIAVGYRLSTATQRRFFLVLSVVTQLTLLGFFKYYDFFISGAERMAGALGLGDYRWQLGIVVPVGISFYTFHTMSYTIDIFRGKIQPTKSLIDFALFVAFFPQMVAGPIARASELLPQFQRFRPFAWVPFQTGAYLIAWGLFKKVFIADNLVKLVRTAYDTTSVVSGPEVVVATYAFAFQIYCDFSAYSDIARGISRMMGIELMLNFNLPYSATNPRDFWRCWHISLSTWLRDYLYLPLGGSRGSTAFLCRNLMLTMVLGGIWHGARINFLWWGIYQGLLLVGHRALEPVIRAMTPRASWGRGLFHLVAWFVFFHLMCYGWLLFRADSNEEILNLSRALLTGWDQVADSAGAAARLVGYCWPLWLVQFFQLRSGNLLAVLQWPWPLRAGLYLVLFYLTVVFGAFHAVEFIYFQF